MYAGLIADAGEDFDGLCPRVVHPPGENVVVDAVPLPLSIVVPDVELSLLDGEVVSLPDRAHQVHDRVELCPPIMVVEVRLAFGGLEHGAVPGRETPSVECSDGVLDGPVEGLHGTFLVEGVLECWSSEALSVEPDQVCILGRRGCWERFDGGQCRRLGESSPTAQGVGSVPRRLVVYEFGPIRAQPDGILDLGVLLWRHAVVVPKDQRGAAA